MSTLLIASLVDPATHPGGAGTWTRGLVAALQHGTDGFDLHLVGPRQAPPGSWHRVRQAVSLAHSCVSRLPAKALFARQRDLRVRIRTILRSRRFDAVVINGSDMLWVAADLPPGMPTLLVAQNLEHRLLDQQLAGFGVLSRLFAPELTKQRDFEIAGFRSAGGVIFVSATEMTESVAQIPGLRALHVPPLFQDASAARRPQSREPLRLGYLADFAWWPNRLNWSWLLEEVLPRVRRPLQLHAFGRRSESIPGRDEVIRHGLVPDLASVWAQADIMVCPTRAGAGVNVKVAESLYHRMPVLATPGAMRGLAATSGPGLRVINDAVEWAAFLDSDEADRFARQPPSDELSDQFSVTRHAAAVKRFVRDTMGVTH